MAFEYWDTNSQTWVDDIANATACYTQNVFSLDIVWFSKTSRSDTSETRWGVANNGQKFEYRTGSSSDAEDIAWDLAAYNAEVAKGLSLVTGANDAAPLALPTMAATNANVDAAVGQPYLDKIVSGTRIWLRRGSGDVPPTPPVSDHTTMICFFIPPAKVTDKFPDAPAAGLLANMVFTTQDPNIDDQAVAKMANRRSTIRGVDIAVGNLLATDNVDSTERAFFAASFPADLECDDFDLTAQPPSEAVDLTLRRGVAPDSALVGPSIGVEPRTDLDFYAHWSSGNVLDLIYNTPNGFHSSIAGPTSPVKYTIPSWHDDDFPGTGTYSIQALDSSFQNVYESFSVFQIAGTDPQPAKNLPYIFLQLNVTTNGLNVTFGTHMEFRRAKSVTFEADIIRAPDIDRSWTFVPNGDDPTFVDIPFQSTVIGQGGTRALTRILIVATNDDGTTRLELTRDNDDWPWTDRNLVQDVD